MKTTEKISAVQTLRKMQKEMQKSFNEWNATIEGIIETILEGDDEGQLCGGTTSRFEATTKKTNSEVTTDVETRVTEILHLLGVPANIRGYYYLRTAIQRVIDDPNEIELVTKRLYPEVAKQHGTTPSRVERAIRHAIEVVWSKGNLEELQKIFQYTVDANKGKTTNSEFIAMIADVIKLELKM